MNDSRPLERQPTASFEKLLHAVAFGNRENAVLSSLASRLARLDRQLAPEDRQAIEALTAGQPLTAITSAIVNALDPDVQLEEAKKTTGMEAPPPEEVEKAAKALLEHAAKPLVTNPALRNSLIEIKKLFEQTIDTVSKDDLLEAGFSGAAREKAQGIVQSFE